MLGFGGSLPSVTWELRLNISELDLYDQSLRVTGDTHIGGVIMQLVDKLSPSVRNDWSQFALFWPEKNQWLKKNKMTLDQYGVQADAVLNFTRINKFIRLKIPDTQVIDVQVDFSINVFSCVKKICKDLSIRYHEELSLLFHKIKKEDLKDESSNKKKNKNKKLTDNSINNNNNNNKENGSSLSSSSNTSTLNNSSSNSFNPNSKNHINNRLLRERSQSLSTNADNLDTSLCIAGSTGGTSDHSVQQSLILSTTISTHDLIEKLTHKHKSIFDRTRLSNKWLDSAKSLMEQNVQENSLIELKFKYYAFIDMNLNTDSIRINQLYEQAKWAILTEEIECSEQDLISFAALQVKNQDIFYDSVYK
jgi:kindlin 2